MKKTLLTLLIIAGAAAVMVAEGQMEDNDAKESTEWSERWDDRRGDRSEMMRDWMEDQEIVTITGELKLVNGEAPVIESGDISYTLMAPWAYTQDLEIESGIELTVEGFEVPGPRFNWDGTEKMLHVTKAVIDGEEYTLDTDEMHAMDEKRFGMQPGKKGGSRGRMSSGKGRY